MTWNDGAPFELHLVNEDAPAVARRSICSLGSGSGGGGGQMTQQKSSSGPPEFLEPYLKEGVGALSNLYHANPNAPAYYPGQTVAPFSTQTQSAIDALGARGANGSPVTASAQNTNMATTGGQYLDLQNNPYFQKALTDSLEPSTRNFTHSILPAITSQFASAGRGNSGAHESAVMDASDILARAQAGAGATAGTAAYNNERSLQQGATALAPGLANQDYIDINQLGSAGQTVDNQAQAKIDADVTKYNYGNNAQWDYINRYLASLNGGYPGGQTTGTQMTERSNAGNGFSSMFGGAMGLAGLGLQAYSAFSDPDLKDDIAVIGHTHDGQPLHLFKYKGDDKPTIGLMADEVERVKPDAVSRHESGFRVVDYSKALGLF